MEYYVANYSNLPGRCAVLCGAFKSSPSSWADVLCYVVRLDFLEVKVSVYQERKRVALVLVPKVYRISQVPEISVQGPSPPSSKELEASPASIHAHNSNTTGQFSLYTGALKSGVHYILCRVAHGC